MRLLLLNQFYAPDISPTAQLAASLARHRAARGDAVTVVASAGNYAEHGQASTGADPGVVVHRVWTPRLGKATVLKRCADYGAFYLGALALLARLPAQDVIIALTTPPYIAWAAALHKRLHPETRVVLWNMDCYPEAAERLGKLAPGGLVANAMRGLNRSLFSELDHLISLDQAMDTLLMSQYAPRARALPSSIIPNWEPLEFYAPDPSPPAWPGLARYGISNRFVVLYLGNMGQGHEFETVLAAAEALRQEPVTFLFIGGGGRQGEIKAEAERRGLANVVVTEYVPRAELKSVMASAGCTLISLRNDCLGVMSPSKLHANLAMGLPVLFIGPKGCNVDEAVDRFACGASLRIGDVGGVLAFVRSGLENTDEFRAYRRRARHAFEAVYCDARALPRFDAVLDSLALHRRAPAPAEAVASALGSPAGR